jgi:hypothetical protein
MAMIDAPPDLQKLVETAGRRLAARCGEAYDPIRHPGWTEISAAEFAAHEQALIAWRQRVLGVKRPREQT